jgi:glycosyltransferase involved in cell wall biosynthesis
MTVSIKPRLLFLGHALPFPPEGGVTVRAFHTVRLLSQKFDVTSLFFARRRALPAGGLEQAVQGMEPYCAARGFPIAQEYSTVRRFRDHAVSLLRRRVYTYFEYESEAFERSLEALTVQGPWAWVHVDSLDLSRYLPMLEGSIACTHHNVESQVLRRRAGMEARPLIRRYLRRQAELMREEEQQWLPKVRMNIAVSEPDRDQLLALSPDARVEVVPNGVDHREFQPSDSTEVEGVVFVGGLDWFPNRDALTYFHDSILPALDSRIEPVTWVGRATPGDVRRYAGSRIRLTGHVPDIRTYVLNAACFIVPLRVGGGTRLKILNAWAMGKAVVSTSLGCAGLTAIDGENILIRDTPEGLADAIANVVRDPALRTRLGIAGRTTIEREYSWDVIQHRFEELYVV